MRNTVIFSILFATVVAMAAPIIREDGVIYLSDHDQKPLNVALAKADTTCFFDRELTRVAGTLRFPQTVKVEAFATDSSVCRIFGVARQGGVAAWIPLSALEPLPENFLKELAAAEERRLMVKELIAKNEVVLGMTQDEVRQSLGRPQKTSRSVKDDKERVAWEFIKYELVPQQVWVPFTHGGGFQQPPSHPKPSPSPGRPGGGGRPQQPPPRPPGWTTDWVLQFVNTKTPVGTMLVGFENGVVVSIDETDENPR